MEMTLMTLIEEPESPSAMDNAIELFQRASVHQKWAIQVRHTPFMYVMSLVMGCQKTIVRCFDCFNVHQKWAI